MAIDKPEKRILNKKMQREYYEEHEFDEYEFHKNGIEVPRDEIHEIVHGSRKTYTSWNMIALSRSNHLKAHSGEITKRELFECKIKSGQMLPYIIQREFDL